MKIRFNRLISVLCAVMLLIGAFSAWAAAEGTPATPTDLKPVEEETVPGEPSEEQKTEPEEKPAEEPEKEPVQEPEKEPEQEPAKEPEGEPEGEPADDAVDSVEVLITKTLTMGQSWEGKMKKTKPVVLKLDLNRPCSVYMLVEGKDVWATVEKSDRVTENPAHTKADPETGRMLVKWEAEEGSYLITLGPVEPNLLAMAKVTFMDKKAYDAWEAEQAEEEAEPEPEEEEEAEPEPEEEEGSEPEEEEPEENPEAEPAEETEPEQGEEESQPEEESDSEHEEEQPEDGEPAEEEEQPEDGEPAEEEEQPEEPAEETGEEAEQEENRPESEEPVEEEEQDPEDAKERSVIVSLKWDVNYPIVGDTAHLSAELYGYEGLEYTLQWQNSPDKEQWNDVPEANELTLDVVMTEEYNHFYWRLVVYLEDEETEE